MKAGEKGKGEREKRTKGVGESKSLKENLRVIMK